jgi:hypothetical protein
LRRLDGLTREELAPEFRTMTLADVTIALAFVTCAREESGLIESPQRLD